MTDPGLSLYTKVRLIPSITDEEIEEMLQCMQPVVFREKGEGGEGLYVVNTEGVSRHSTAYTWDPGAPSLFKPSLAEALACIRAFVPEGWRDVKFFWVDSRNLDNSNCLPSGFHFARCHLFASEFPESKF